MDHQVSYGVTYPYTAADEELLQRFADPAPISKPGYITDFLGIRTNVAFFPDAAARSGDVVRRIPIPDDSLHAQGIEYVSIAEALSTSQSDELSIVEVGAGWAPWACAGAIIARRLGKSSRLLATEMLADKVEQIFHHLRENNVYSGNDRSLDAWHQEDGCSVKVIRAAASSDDGFAYVPIVRGDLDHGARPSMGKDDVDYRGMPIQTEQLKAISLTSMLGEIAWVDYLHIDVQGYERQIIPPSLDALIERVGYMLVGTHSRSVEGELMELMYGAGWSLEREEPCVFQLDGPARLTLEARTLIDGVQLWRNPRLSL